MPIYKIEGKSKNGKQAYRVRVPHIDNTGKHKQLERTVYGKTEAVDMEGVLRNQISQATNLDILSQKIPTLDEFL